jgi:hypothetical protein
MRWGKFLLFFQAITTLIIGIIFFLQVFNIQYNYEYELQEQTIQNGISSVMVYNELAKYEEFKKRFFDSSYVLVLVSLMEVIIIWRLFDHETTI